MTNPWNHATAVLLATAMLATVSMAAAGSAPSSSSGATPTLGPTLDHLVSDDGRLTIDLPFGVDPGVDGLSIVVVDVAGPAVAAYELRPVDTSLAVPVTATWLLDPSGATAPTIGDQVWLAMAHADDAASGRWSWLDEPHIAVVAGAYAITGRLSRFGTLIVTQVPTLVRGPEAVWGHGYAPGLAIDVPLDLTLVTSGGTPSTSAFSGDWGFEGGYPDVIDVATSGSEADHLAATWRCQRIEDTSLTTTFGVLEDPQALGPTSQSLGLGPAAVAFTVTFPVACGRVHAQPNG